MATSRTFVDLQLVGGREFLAALKALEPSGMQAHVIQPALREGGEIVRADVERAIPRDSGRLAESLRLTVAKTRARIIVGKGGKSGPYYGKFLEFGTAKMRARPFMRPALDHNKGRIVAIFICQLQMVVDRIGRSSRGARGSVQMGGYK